MLTDLIDDSIFDSLGDEPTTPTGHFAVGWSISLRKTTDAVSPPYTMRTVAHGGHRGVKIVLAQSYPWFRLEQHVPPAGLSAGRYRFAMTYTFQTSEDLPAPRVKVLEYASGQGQTFVNIASKLVPTTQPVLFEKNFEVPVAANPDLTYRLSFEFHGTGTFTFSDLTFQQIEDLDPEASYVAPYRVARSGVGRHLSEVNDTMDRSLPSDPGAWLHGALECALELNDLTTAHGLCQTIRQTHPDDPKVLTQTAALIARTLLAEGSLDELRTLLVRCASLNVDDDLLSCVGRWLEDPLDAAARAQDFALPSSGVDVFNLNRAVRQGRVPFETLLECRVPAQSAPLVWANYLLRRSEPEYLRQINLYLRRCESPYEVALADASGPILERLRFVQVHPLGDLWADGPLVSVIVDAGGSAEETARSLRCALAQTYEHTEILLASPDFPVTGTQPDADTDRRVRRFAAPPDAPRYAVRDELVRQSHGELIAFVSPGVQCFPHRLALEVTRMVAGNVSAAVPRGLRMDQDGYLVHALGDDFASLLTDDLMVTRGEFERCHGFRSVSQGAGMEFLGHLQDRLGGALITLDQPVAVAPWRPHLERPRDVDLAEVGYVPADVRPYLAASARRRVLGAEIVSDALVDAAAAPLRQHPLSGPLAEVEA